MVTSSDYVTNEVLNLHMARMESLMREHFARTESENAKFREQMREDFRNFRDEVRGDINTFKKEVNTRFDGLQAQISVMQNDITGLKHDVNNLFHWDYWILAIIVAAFAMPHIIESIKLLLGAVRDGVAGILALFKKDSKTD